MAPSGNGLGRTSLVGHMGKLGPAVEAQAAFNEENDLIGRIWAHDHTVWKPEDTEIADRLGWLHCPGRMIGAIPELTEFTEELRHEGVTDCLLLGMGGSSLAPEVCRHIFGVRAGFLNLQIMDTTHPDSVAEVSRSLRPESTLFLVSSKSGGTVETLSLMNYFYNFAEEILGRGNAGRSFAAITDPGSGLEKAGMKLGFRKIFLNDPDIGGRYAALSYVGLVPAALIGMNLELFLKRAEEASAGAALKRASEHPGANSAAWLGTAMGVCSREGRNKLTLVASSSVSTFAAWAEQLIAESTGKEGKGIVPVVGENVYGPEAYRDDRLFVYLKEAGGDGLDRRVAALAAAGHPVIQITLEDLYYLGGEFFRWEMATAVAGHVLGVNPFDQPDVESAKLRAKQAVEVFRSDGGLPVRNLISVGDGIGVIADSAPDSASGALAEFLEAALLNENDNNSRPYLSIQAYLPPGPEVDRALHVLRESIRENFRVPVTVGYGPRFLHSTGQLHKGGGEGLFVQITSESEVDVPIPDSAGEPDSSVSFGVLIRAQSIGDSQALIDSGHKVLSFHLNGDVPEKIQSLAGGLRK
jgi:glucose-6-phosphate isomerase